MDEKDKRYRIPADFNPYSCADRIRALTEATHYLVTTGPMVENPAPEHALAALHALLDMLRVEVVKLHDYLREIENSTTLDLPQSDEDFERLRVKRDDRVRQIRPPLYLASSRKS